jgi:hypothetical protein
MNKKIGIDLKGRTIIETDFWDGGDWLIELVECGDGRPTLLLFHKADGEWTEKAAFGFETEKHRFRVPTPELGLKQVRFARRWNSVPITLSMLFQEMDDLMVCCLDLDQNSRFLLACFVLSSWLVDCLPVAPYLALVGLPGSGKSTALRVLRLLCRRSLLTSDISSAAFYNLCTQLMPTLLIDETETSGQKRSLFHLLRSGSTPDAVVLRDKESFRGYSAKVVAWTELPDDEALNSRCVILTMRESFRTDLSRPSDPAIVEMGDHLQACLIHFRVNNYHKTRTAKIPLSGRPHGRARDLYEALALPLSEDPELCQRLLACLEQQQEVHRERLSPRQTAVLEALGKNVRQSPNEETCSLKSLTKDTNQELVKAGEHFHLNEKAVGSTLTSLALTNRKRINSGYVLCLDSAARKYVHDCLVRHGSGCPSADAGGACEYCNPPASPKSEPPASQ